MYMQLFMTCYSVYIRRLIMWFMIGSVYRWFSPDVTAAMLVHRTIEKKVFWEFDSIIMKNMSHNLLLFCAPTWPSHHVIENHLLVYLLETCMLLPLKGGSCPAKLVHCI